VPLVLLLPLSSLATSVLVAVVSEQTDDISLEHSDHGAHRRCVVSFLPRPFYYKLSPFLILPHPFSMIHEGLFPNYVPDHSATVHYVWIFHLFS